MEVAIAIVGAVIALAAALVASYQALVARQAVKQASLMILFSTFDVASQTTLTNPELLYSVHGLDRSIPTEEAANIAYLSLVLDGFQHYYGEELKGNFQAMEAKLKRQSTFLNRILAVPENQQRWQYLKNLYYGEFDKDFVHAIEGLIKYENSKKNSSIKRPHNEVVPTP